MSIPDDVFRRTVSGILQSDGDTATAAKKIRDLVEGENRFFDLKQAPDELRISARTMFRRIKAGRLATKIIGGRTMVDVRGCQQMAAAGE